MKVHSKKLLSVLLAMMMALGLMAPALATEGTTTTSRSSVQITKKLRIGRGITVPNETFKFIITPSTEAELAELKDEYKDGYLNQDLSQQGVSYPDLTAAGEASNSGIAAKVVYSSGLRGDGATDTELTFLTDPIDFSSKTWPSAGVYIYTVREIAGSTDGMTAYDNSHYFLKVYVANDESVTPHTTKVTDVRVLGLNEAKTDWVKVEGAPTDTKETVNEAVTDGCDDYRGNEFVFVNTYEKMVGTHPNTDTTLTTSLPNAFYLSKAVSGQYANKTDAFDFLVTVTLPESYSGSTDTDVLRAVVNGYSAHNIDPAISEGNSDVEVALANNTQYSISLRHGDAFQIKKLPAGTVIDVEEAVFQGRAYAPSFVGKWGLDVTNNNIKRNNNSKGRTLASGSIVVGENGAYIQYTNTLDDNDVTPTGIVISNLPYILMVGISLAGIGFFTLSKKRRNS